MRKHQRLWAPCLALMAMGLSGLCGATDAISCSGIVSTIGIHGTDRVMLRLSGMNNVVQICNLSTTIGTTYPITAEQCKAVYATLIAAFAMGTAMNVYFDNVQAGTSCSTFAGWEVATARWVHLEQ